MPPRHPRSASIMSSLTSAGARLPAWQTSNGGSGSGRSVDWLRYCSLFCSFLVALSAGSNYGFSAYSPQLQERLHLTSTQINIVGVMGNMGVYLSGPFWGRLVDRRGPKGCVQRALSEGERGGKACLLSKQTANTSVALRPDLHLARSRLALF